MKRQTLLILILICVLATACTGMRTVKGNSSVPSGTVVDYRKMMNPAYAEDYIGADVITQVEFYSPKPSNNWQTKIPKDHIVFQVIPIEGQAKESPFGGRMGDYVFIPKLVGDIVFELEPGDRIELRGGTRVRKGIVVGGLAIVEFMATSVRKL